MGPVLREGRVIWYDAARGYGFIHEGNDRDVVFITKSVLDAFGISGLNAGLEVVFEAVKGRKSERVNSIVKLRGAQPIH
jgi:cold shock CspA family protein